MSLFHTCVLDAPLGWIPSHLHSYGTLNHNDSSPRSGDARPPQRPPALWASQHRRGGSAAHVCGSSLRWNCAWSDVYPGPTVRPLWPPLNRPGSATWESGGRSSGTGSRVSSWPAARGRPGCSRGFPHERLWRKGHCRWCQHSGGCNSVNKHQGGTCDWIMMRLWTPWLHRLPLPHPLRKKTPVYKRWLVFFVWLGWIRCTYFT